MSDTTGGSARILVPGSAQARVPRTPDRRATPGRRLWYCFQESRPAVQVMFLLRFGCGVLLVGLGLGGVSAQEASRAVAAGAGWALATLYTYLVNGVEDVTEDRINAVGRPISRGDLDPGDALLVARACALLAIGAAWWAGEEVFAATAVYLALGHLYSVPPARLAATPAGALTVVLGGVGLTYVAGGLALGAAPRGEGSAFVVVMILWTTLVGATVKDLSDLLGDEAGGRRPLAARWGPWVLRRAIAGVALALGAAMLVAGAVWPVLLPSGAVLLAGAVVVAVRLLRRAPLGGAVPVDGAAAVDGAAPVDDVVPVDDAVRRRAGRRPYRAFMVTQFAVHLTLLASIALS